MFIYTAKSDGRGSFHGSLSFAISRSCFWIAHHHDQSDRDKSDHGGEHVEGRRISQSADQESRNHRAGRLADVPDGSEHAHGGAEAPRRGKICDERIGHRRNRADADTEQRRCKKKKGQTLATENQRQRRSAKQETNDDDGYSPDAIRDASGYRLRHHGQDQLCAENDRDLGIVEPYIFGVDRQESEKRPVAEVHDGLDAGRDENRRRPQHLGETLPKFRRSRAESLSLARRPTGIGEQQHHKQGEHAERADEKISHRIAGGEIKHEAADERPRSCTDVVCRREPTEPSAPPGLAETRNVSRGDGGEDRGREAMYET